MDRDENEEYSRDDVNSFVSDILREDLDVQSFSYILSQVESVNPVELPPVQMQPYQYNDHGNYSQLDPATPAVQVGYTGNPDQPLLQQQQQQQGVDFHQQQVLQYSQQLPPQQQQLSLPNHWDSVDGQSVSSLKKLQSF